MNGLLLVIITVFLNPKFTFSEHDYCNISPVHTMCRYSAISKNCVRYSTQNENLVKRIILDHNKARSMYAGGDGGYFIPNMQKLYWDQELADISAMWACQCQGKHDDNRDVSRFLVGQLIWSHMDISYDFTWKYIWKSIISSGGGFYSRNYWGDIVTEFNISKPLSLIYNPHLKYFGCTLAKYLVWSIEDNGFAFSATLVCNYGPIKSIYENNSVEDWPCRSCPPDLPCFTHYYRRNEEVHVNFDHERNLCIDPKLENIIPRPGKSCHVGRGTKLFTQTLRNIRLPKVSNTSTPQVEFQGSEIDYEDGWVDNSGNIRYCNVACYNPAVHTMCRYKDNSSQCLGFINLMDKNVAEDLLDLHNSFRNRYAEGSTTPSHPLASDMVVLKWSTVLQNIAHRWISQCQLRHDSCRDTFLPNPNGARFPSVIYRVNQNLGWRRFSNNESCPSYQDLFNDWIKEGKLFSHNTYKEYLQYNSSNETQYENFVQLIWAATSYVGCSFATFDQNQTKVVFLVCNYAPGGRVDGKPIFNPGGPCTNCWLEKPELFRRCEDKYPNLCANEAVAPNGKQIYFYMATILLFNSIGNLFFPSL